VGDGGVYTSVPLTKAVKSVATFDNWLKGGVIFDAELQDSLYRNHALISTSLWLYSTDAPIEQVLVHWENRHLLSSF
jgi:hypothetical protein